MSKISQQRKIDILNAAYTEFVQKGIDGTSMSDIASRAGIGKSTIYEYFPSKEQLLTDACVMFLQDMEGNIVEKLQQEGTVQSCVLAYCQGVMGYMGMVEALGNMASKSATGDDTLRPMVEGYMKQFVLRVEGVLETVLRQGQASGEIRGDIDLGIAPKVIRSLPSMQLIWGLESVDHGMERAVAMMMAGLLA